METFLFYMIAIPAVFLGACILEKIWDFIVWLLGGE